MRFLRGVNKSIRGSGFTLIELLITVAIVGVLASVTLPLAELTVQRSKERELRLALRQIRDALDAYRQAVEEQRIPRNADESSYPKSLGLLVDGVVDAKDPKAGKIYFLRRIPRDPMMQDETRSAEDLWGKRSYASPPDDPREGADVFDVFSRSAQLGLNGRPYREW